MHHELAAALASVLCHGKVCDFFLSVLLLSLAVRCMPASWSLPLLLVLLFYCVVRILLLEVLLSIGTFWFWGLGSAPSPCNPRASICARLQSAKLTEERALGHTPQGRSVKSIGAQRVRGIWPLAKCPGYTRCSCIYGQRSSLNLRCVYFSQSRGWYLREVAASQVDKLTTVNRGNRPDLNNLAPPHPANSDFLCSVSTLQRQPYICTRPCECPVLGPAPLSPP